jgi:hypothetical protein
MKSIFVTAALLFFATVIASAAQSSSSGSQAGSDSAKPAQPSSPAGAQDEADKNKKKPKKVWTNDEISTVGGEGSISVVGNSADAQAKPDSRKTANPPKERQIAAYRERLRQLHNELEATDKKIYDLRNFRAENTSPSGGISMNHGYSMTPVEDQVKSLEVKKKQIQYQIDSVEDQARKSGVEPGQLR